MEKKEKKEKRKENYSEWVHADANALCADANECKKKRRKKKKLTWNGSMQTGMRCVRMVLHVDGLACGWSCMQMVLRADGLACRWCCMQMGCMGTWMVVAAEMVGADECKKKTKK